MSGIVVGVWDNIVPVMLPYGGVTMAGVVPASIGVCVPFVVLMLAVFSFMYTEHWSKQHSEQIMEQQQYAGESYQTGFYCSRRTGRSQQGGEYFNLVVVGGA